MGLFLLYEDLTMHSRLPIVEIRTERYVSC